MQKIQSAQLDLEKDYTKSDQSENLLLKAVAGLECSASEVSADASISHNLFRALIDNISDFIYVKDKENRYVICNRSLPLINGISSPDEMIGKTDFDIYPMALAHRYHRDEQKLYETGNSITKEAQPVINDRGDIKWVTCTKVPFRDEIGNIIGLVGIERDITDHKLLEEKIIEQANLLDEAPDAIIVRDTGDRILYWNKSAERLYGYSAQEAKGIKSIELIDEDEITKAIGAEQTVIDKGSWSGDLIQRTKENKKIIVHSRQTLVQDKLGYPKVIFVINTDVTEKKALDTQMLRAQRMEGIGTLAGGIAHDLNNLLAPILLVSDLLLSNPHYEKSLDLLKTIKKSAKHAGSVVNQVLTFARGVEDGKFILFHPKHTVKEIIQITREIFPKNISINYNIPKELWPIKGDPTQIHQVLLNICINARDAMIEGGDIHILADKEFLDESLAAIYPGAQKGPYLTIEITDTGHGMSNECMKLIFDPFYTTKIEGNGTGLGLSTSHGIIRNHGGFITVKSKEGHGSVFKLYLPAVTNELVISPERYESKFPKANGEMILVVDDETAICEMVEEVLGKQGYNVLTAKDGTEATAKFVKYQKEIRVVMTDIIMPYMDGVSLSRTLIKMDPEVKIIATTGQGHEKHKTDLDLLGVKTMLEKPYFSESLIATVREVLDSK